MGIKDEIAQIRKRMEKAIEDIAPYSWSRHSSDAKVRQFIAQEYLWLAQSPWTAGREKAEDRRRLLNKVKECQ